ncbi:MAG: hypothetical protein AB7O28_20730 [Vicinamibacterales bacterium]
MARHRCVRRRIARAAAAVCAAVLLSAPSAQERRPPSLVARMHAYLDAYEVELSALIADEAFVQRTSFTSEYGNSRVSERRQLVSEVGFLRLPGGLAWLGQRSVQRVDGRLVRSEADHLDQAFATAGPNLFARARAIADANAQYNLGHPRSLNLPTLPLDLLGRRRAAGFVTTLQGTTSIAGHRTTRLLLNEHPPGGIIASDDGLFVRADVRAWVRDDGAVLRAHVTLHAPAGRGRHEVRVDFRDEPDLGLLVPVRLSETYDGRPSGEGVATYTRFRRFTTSGRLVPPPPIR